MARRFDNNQNDEIHYEEIDHTELEIVQVKLRREECETGRRKSFFVLFAADRQRIVRIGLQVRFQV